jgi:hypothetical protein
VRHFCFVALLLCCFAALLLCCFAALLLCCCAALPFVFILSFVFALAYPGLPWLTLA